MGFGATANRPVAAPVAEKQEPKGGPVSKIKYGGITVDVWKNSGTHSDFYTFTIQRSYKKDDKWANTNSLRAQDLPKVILALQEAYKESLTSEQDDGQ